MITAVRIKAVTTIEFQNTTHSLASVGILADLEPLLGVINASLPILKPVLDKFSKSAFVKWNRRTLSRMRSKATGDKVSGKGSGVGHARQFQRLGDTTYVLEDIINTSSGVTCHGGEVGLGDHKAFAWPNGEAEKAKQIHIRRDWDVVTSE